jgi:predicted amidohydrolase YtcJ
VIDPAPELILHGGRVYTVDDAFSTAEALAIKGGRLVGVGSDAEIRPLAGRTTRQLDLANRTVLPGFIDGHNHMVGFGLFALALSLEGATSCSDVCERIAARAAVMPPGQWIICGPIGTQPYCLDAPGCLAEGRFPTRRELDAAAPEHPVYVWYSVGKPPPAPALLNSLGLARLGLDREPPPAEMAHLAPDSEGSLSILEITSPFAGLVWLYTLGLPDAPPARYCEAVLAATNAYLAAGITGVYEAHGVRLEELRAYAEVHARGEMRVRTHVAVGAELSLPLEVIERQLQQLTYAVPPGLGDDVLQVDGIGISFDGPTGHGMSFMREPYLNQFGQRWQGIQYAPTEKFLEVARLAARYGLRVQTQCSGGAAIDAVLDAYEAVDREISIRDARWVIEHCQFPSARNLEQCQRLGVVPTTCTNFLWGQTSTGYYRFFGRELAQEAVPLRRWLDAGLPIAQSSDYGPYPPLFTLWQSLARRDALTGDVVGPDQRISREEALRIYTRNGAYATFRERDVGSIEVGKLADLVVLDADPLTCAEEQIPDVAVLATIVGGQIVYDSGAAFGPPREG